jgi:hypothetical protein
MVTMRISETFVAKGRYFISPLALLFIQTVSHDQGLLWAVTSVKHRYMILVPVAGSMRRCSNFCNK